MLRSIKKKLILIHFPLILITITLFTSSCSGSETPTTIQPSSSTPPQQINDWPASATGISPGQHLRFDSISLEQGLSQVTVFCILQDSQGFMWFGTEDGLNKFDGYKFTVYKHDREDDDSLGGSWISAMLEDDFGALWFGTLDSGLDRYDKELDQFTHFRHDPQDPSSLSDDRITALYQDREGNLWVGTNRGGLDRYDPETESFIHYPHDPKDTNSLSSNAVTAIYEDQEGGLWIGTPDEGLNMFMHASGNWWRYGHDPSNPDSLSHNHVTSISEDPSGALWIGTRGGGLNKLALLKGKAPRFRHFQHQPDNTRSLSSDDVSAIYQDQEGVLWIGTRDAGLNRMDPEKGSFSHYRNIPGDVHSLSNNYILSIYQDREGVLWFGTIASGINKLGVGKWRFPHYEQEPNNTDSLGDNMIRALYQDPQDQLWIGTMFGGVDRFDRETGEWRHFSNDPDDPDSLSENWVTGIYRDNSGVLWIGTRNGLDKFDPDTETFRHYQPDPTAPPGSDSNNVRVIYEDQAGELWVGTYDGLNRFDREKEIWSHAYRHDPSDPNSLGYGWIMNIQEDSNGILWIGTTRGGLNKFNREEETFTSFQNDPDDPHSLSENLVISLLLDQEGILWVGTAGGLDRFDPETETFAHYREKDGLPNEKINCMEEDRQGRLWLTTNKGMSMFDPQTEAFRNYEVTDGLQSNEFNAAACHLSESGEMFFGGVNGFNAFFPDRIRDNPIIPPVFLTSLTQNGRELGSSSSVENVTEITLEWPENAFEFEYVALSYAKPEKNQYAYYLEGFEHTWNEVGTRRNGQYTNLPGGTYTLRVKGSNNDGVWNEVGTSMKITIVPPFWQTWWFIGIASLTLAGFVFGGYRLRVRNLEARSRELEFQVKQRTADLLEKEEALHQSELEKVITTERNRLARDLHDSVTQSLYSLTLFSEAARHLAEEQGSKSIEQQIKQIGIIGTQALKEMRLLVYELQPPELERDGLVRALRKRLEAVEGRAGVGAHLEVDELFKLPGNVELELFRIAQEALNNSLKHAEAASVVVFLRKENSSIEMEVADDGVGFDPQSLPDHGGMGLKSIRERTEQLGGIVEIHSIPGNGTRIKVIIEDFDGIQQYRRTQ